MADTLAPHPGSIPARAQDTSGAIAEAVRDVWPDPDGPLSRRTVLLVAAAAAAGAGVPFADAGVGVLLAGVATAAAAASAVPGGVRAVPRLRPDRVALGVLSIALLGVVVLRDAPWLVSLCLLAAGGCGALAVTGTRTFAGAVLSGLTVPVAALRGLPWLRRSLPGMPRSVVTLPLLRVVAGTAVLLATVGGLLAGGDAVFASLLGHVVPQLRLDSFVARGVGAAMVGGFALCAAYAAAAPPRWDTLAPDAGRTASALEWAVPVVALDLLLGGWLLVQVVAAFGGVDRILHERGITYATYAREGFAYLVGVTLVVGAVLVLAARKAPTTSSRLLVRLALGTLCLLTLGVVGCALRRLGLYEHAFGMTRARLFAGVSEAWVGFVVVLGLVAGVRWRSGWLARAVPASAALVMLGLALVDPDAVVARSDVARFERTGAIDTGYLGRLSADAVAALDRLPEPQRSCALASIALRLDEQQGGWVGGNVSRSTARGLLSRRPLRPCSDIR